MRSISMSQAIGPDLNNTDRSPRGQWLPNPPYRVYIKETQLSDPPPALLWIMIDEHPDSINDGFYLNNPNGPVWGDLPASYHNGAAGLSFGDGHSEIHKWVVFRTKRPVTFTGFYGFNILPGTHPIVPIMLGDAALATKFADAMLARGVYVIGFSYPVVPQGKARPVHNHGPRQSSRA